MILNFFKNLSPIEIAIIVFILVVILGRKFMVGLGKTSGQTYKEIKKAKKSITDVTNDSGVGNKEEVSN